MGKVHLRMGIRAALFALALSTGLTGCLGLGNKHESYHGHGHMHRFGGRAAGCGVPGCADCGHNGGHMANGYMANGQMANGHMANGQTANGQMANGHASNGHMSNGHQLGQPGYEQGPAMMNGAFGPHGPCPTELDRVSLPPYKVAPPDILFIDMVRMVPRPPYRVEPLETLVVIVTDTLPNQPISGPFVITPEGTINLGYSYGSVYVGGMTIDQIQNAIRNHLTGRALRNPQVNVSLAQFRGFQQIRGEHLVRPDGTISLGVYGSVYVAGLSLGQAKCVIEKHLSEYFLNPQLSVDVFAYNSRVVYVIVDGGGLGQQIFPLPSTGNETVLDAISKVQGLAPVSSKRRIWVARPSPVQLGCNQILPVDWRAITEAGSTGTNYQLFPGDRVYVAAQPLIALDNYLSIVLAPIERVFGVMLLGNEAISSFIGGSNNNGGAIIVP